MNKNEKNFFYSFTIIAIIPLFLRILNQNGNCQEGNKEKKKSKIIIKIKIYKKTYLTDRSKLDIIRYMFELETTNL